MALSGKYDFRGIKKLGGAGLRVALASSPYTAWFIRLGSFADLVLEFAANWLANKGLLVLNVGANYVSGEIDQKQLDAALDSAFEQITIKGGREKLTPAERKAIDDEVIKAARKFLVIARPK